MGKSAAKKMYLTKSEREKIENRKLEGIYYEEMREKWANDAWASYRYKDCIGCINEDVCIEDNGTQLCLGYRKKET